MSENKMSEERLSELLEKEAQLQKRKERERKYGERSRIRSKLMVKKAIEAGLTVSEKEVDEELKRMKK